MTQARPNPYVGPRSFKTGETLFGRDREVPELLDLLIAERIVLLYSPSGAGKTSLIQAALIPELENEGFRVRPVMRVGLDPPPAVNQDDGDANRYVLSSLLSLEKELSEGDQKPWEELTRMQLIDYLGAEPDNEVLIFDQFEDILTVDPTHQEAREEFFSQVGVALRDRGRWALFAMREDYVPGLDPYLASIPTRLTSTFRLDLLGERAARQAMQNPARRAGVDFTDEAARNLVDDLRQMQVQRPDGQADRKLGPHVEPVQLQVVCRQLWESLPADASRITEENFEEEEDVDAVLAGYYEENVARIAREVGVNERDVREWFDRQLITDSGIRAQILQEHQHSKGLDNRAISALVDTHLVRAEKRRGATWFELAHDRLILPVRADNAAWRRDNLSVLQRKAAIWNKEGRPGELLLRDANLADAECWAEEHQDDLTAAEKELLAASREERTRAEQRKKQAAREKRQAYRFRLVAIISSIASVVAIIALVVAWIMAKEAAVSRITLHAQKATRLQEKLLLCVEALKIWPYDQDARNQLSENLALLPKVVDTVEHKGRVAALAFSRNGKYLATAGEDKTAVLWDVENGVQLPPLVHDKKVDAVALNETGTLLATITGGNRITLWAVPGGEEKWHIVHSDTILGVAFSPDGPDNHYLAFSSEDRTVRLWNLKTRQEEEGLVLRHRAQIRALEFSRDGKYLATGTYGKIVRLRAVEKPNDQKVLLCAGRIEAVAFSPDGRYVAAGGHDRTVWLWDVPGGREVARFPQEAIILDLAFSSDSKHLAAATGDGTARYWDVDEPLEVTRLPHRGSVLGVAFSSSGDYLATKSENATVRVWNVKTGREIIRFTDVVPDSIVGFSPDGVYLATRSDEKTVLVSRVDNGWRSRKLSFMSWELPWLPDHSAEACERLSRNLTYEEWKNAMGDEPYSKTCERLPVHPSLIEDSWELARSVKVHDAAEIKIHDAAETLSRAQKLSPGVEIDPELESMDDPELVARRLAAESLVASGEKLAREGRKEYAIAHFAEARKLDLGLGFDPEAKAATLTRARGLVASGEAEARCGRVVEAIEQFREAQELDQGMKIPGSSWDALCRAGGLWGFSGHEVIGVCDKAVAAVSGRNESARLRRAVVLAHGNEYRRAVEDLAPYVAWLEEVERSTGDEGLKEILRSMRRPREQWITKLNAGENPFTPELLEKLRDESGFPTACEDQGEAP
ncbi:MAG: hypothetical protein GY856_49085 [bacterium]|nr:hypothetical protein [bacterium]